MKRIGRDPKDPAGWKGFPRDARIEMTGPVRLKRADNPLPPRKGSLAHRARSLPPRCGAQRLTGRGGCAANAPRVALHLPEGQWDHSCRRSQERAFESHAGAPPPVLADHIYKRVHTRSLLQTSYPPTPAENLR